MVLRPAAMADADAGGVCECLEDCGRLWSEGSRSPACNIDICEESLMRKSNVNKRSRIRCESTKTSKQARSDAGSVAGLGTVPPRSKLRTALAASTLLAYR